MKNLNYHREYMRLLEPTNDMSFRYWRRQANNIFEQYPQCNVVEIVRGGKIKNSFYLANEEIAKRSGAYIILCSTAGQYGKSRRDINKFV